MLFVRRDPFASLWGEMNRVQEQMNRLYGPAADAPRMSVWEDADHFYAETDLPGVAAEKVEVTVTEGDQLTVTAERPAPQFEGAVWHRQERPTGTFTRSVALPSLVDADKVEARLEDGVLRLKLPKSEAAKPRKIPVLAN